MRFVAPRPGTLHRALAEADHIHAVLANVGGNKTLAAKTLGIDQSL